MAGRPARGWARPTLHCLSSANPSGVYLFAHDRRKVGKAYFALLDVLCHNHANVIATRDTGALPVIVQSVA